MLLNNNQSLHKCYRFPTISAGKKIKFGVGRHNSGCFVITEINISVVGLFDGATPLQVTFMIFIFRLHLCAMDPAVRDRSHEGRSFGQNLRDRDFDVARLRT